MMHWFTYDHFNPSSAYDFWTGETNALPPPYAKSVVQEDIPAAFPRIDCNSWGADDFIVGMKISGGRVCVFRIFDGGRDRCGRPDRWVMLLAEGEQEDFAGTDLLSAADSATFRDFAATSRAPKATLPTNRIPWTRNPAAADASAHSAAEQIDGELSENEFRTLSVAFSSDAKAEGFIFAKKQGERIAASVRISREPDMKWRAPQFFSSVPPPSRRERRWLLVAALVGALGVGAIIGATLGRSAAEEEADRFIERMRAQKEWELERERENSRRNIRRLLDTIAGLHMMEIENQKKAQEAAANDDGAEEPQENSASAAETRADDRGGNVLRGVTLRWRDGKGLIRSIEIPEWNPKDGIPFFEVPADGRLEILFPESAGQAGEEKPQAHD